MSGFLFLAFNSKQNTRPLDANMVKSWHPTGIVDFRSARAHRTFQRGHWELHQTNIESRKTPSFSTGFGGFWMSGSGLDGFPASTPTIKVPEIGRSEAAPLAMAPEVFFCISWAWAWVIMVFCIYTVPEIQRWQPFRSRCIWLSSVFHCPSAPPRIGLCHRPE